MHFTALKGFSAYEAQLGKLWAKLLRPKFWTRRTPLVGFGHGAGGAFLQLGWDDDEPRKRARSLGFRIQAWAWFKGEELRAWLRDDKARREAVGADEWARSYLAGDD